MDERDEEVVPLSFAPIEIFKEYLRALMHGQTAEYYFGIDGSPYSPVLIIRGLDVTLL